MKLLSITTMLSGLTITLLASNNTNADKTIRFSNASSQSLFTYSCPTDDGGMYSIYNPIEGGDSVLIFRFDADANKIWSQSFLPFNNVSVFIDCSDNGIAFAQNDTTGAHLAKINSDGSIAYTIHTDNIGIINMVKEKDGAVRITSIKGLYIVSALINNTGLSDSVLWVSTDTMNYTISSIITTSKIDTDIIIQSGNTLMRITEKGKIIWAKHYDVLSIGLTILSCKVNHEGNIIAVGTTNNDGCSITKINGLTGEIIWMKRYLGGFGSFTTTDDNFSFTVDLYNFEKVTEMPTGNIVIAAHCSYKWTNISRSKSGTAVLTFNASGDPLQSYYISLPVKNLNNFIPDQRFEYNNLFSIEPENGGAFLSCTSGRRDSSNATLLDLENISELCDAAPGNVTVTPLGLYAAIDVTVFKHTSAITIQNAPIYYRGNALSTTTENVCFKNTTGIPQIAGDNTFTISPNPIANGGQIRLNINNPSAYSTINLIDITGRTIVTQKVEIGKNILQLQSIAKGTYLVQITGEHILQQTQKLIVTE